MKQPNPERSFGFLLHEVARLLRMNFSRRVQALGLTLAQSRVLAHLSCNEGINQTALADILEIQPITLARLVDRLETAGWVERRPDPSDRRAQRLFLTDNAHPILDQIWTLAAETREEAMTGLAAAAREQIIDALLTMKQNLLRADAAPAMAATRAKAGPK